MIEGNGKLLLENLRPLAPGKTAVIAKIFNNTTNSYKMIWFIALLSWIKKNDGLAIKFEEMLLEFLVTAWAPACMYKLYFGPQDQIPRTINKIGEKFCLDAKITLEQLKELDMEFILEVAESDGLLRYVPYRILTPWFDVHLKGLNDCKKNKEIIRLSIESQSGDFPSLYMLESGQNSDVFLNCAWRDFIKSNMGIIETFAEYNLAMYLQARNPGVPGILNKLYPPINRNLSKATKFWERVQQNCKNDFIDIYTGRPLESGFSIDHFLPWSFVAHDQLWNLVPVTQSVNSKKGDKLPDVEKYLFELVKLHKIGIDVHLQSEKPNSKNPSVLDDFYSCFKLDRVTLAGLSLETFYTEYRKIILPQVEIAANLGFETKWSYKP